MMFCKSCRSLPAKYFFLTGLVFIINMSVAVAEPAATQKILVPANVSETQSWANFEPVQDNKYDWIQLKSNEWLKGELESFYNFSLEFDSDKLGMLTFDWEDVKQLRTAKPKSIRVEEGIDLDSIRIVTGIIYLDYQSAKIINQNETQTFQRAQIISIAKGYKNEINYWAGKIVLGANFTGGNSELVDASLIISTQRRSAKSRLKIEYAGNFSETQNIETSNNHRLSSNYDLFFNKKLFWRVYGAEYVKDTFRNIDTQLSLGSSFGYHLIHSAKTEWEISGGVGDLYTRFVSVEPGENIETTSPFIEFGTRLDTKLTKTVDFLLEYTLQFVEEKSGERTHHLISTLSTDLYADLELDISLVWDRINKPQPLDDGTEPEKDDYQLIFGLSYKF